MTIPDLLAQLAKRYNVATGYTSASGKYVEIPRSSIIYALAALGVPISAQPDEEELTGLLFREYTQRMSRPLPPAVVTTAGTERQFTVHVHDGAPARLHIELEGGGRAEVYQDDNFTPPAHVDGQMWGEATFHVPGNLPEGYHEIHLDSDGIGKACCPLIVAPRRLETADPLLARPRTGVMAQLYSVRSRNSWGIGDFSDLGLLAETVATEAGADYLLINPLHAAEPFPPVEDSPYLPTSRRFINPIYLSIADIPELDLLPADIREDVEELQAEFRERNTSAQHIVRDEIYAAKLQVLRELFSLPRPTAREEAFQAFREREGEGLRKFAAWCAQQELAATPNRRHARSTDHAELVEFYSWLQFLCDEQLAAAQERATAAGMEVGLITDLAVGIHAQGADAAALAQYLVPEASVGAPPDDYNQMGQDWSQPPWHPERLAESGYRPWRDMLATVLRNAGGVRVDHILGLFRLYWIPKGQPPTMGTYVSYDWEAMVGVLTLEAKRAGAIVVGEDLGTLEPWVAGALADRGLMGTSIIWFESAADGSGPLPASDYRPLALSSVGTHDLPPTLGYLAGEHITLRNQLGLLTRSVDEELAIEREWMDQVLDFAAPGAQTPKEQVVALHEFISSTPSALTCTNLVDLVGDRRTQNMPGTTRALYPNWCIPLTDDQGQAVLLEDLPDYELFQQVAQAAKR
ncbi:4-alpha-glucanotransferase [Corynebacterium phocae]|uniref:4-alpha-glucanotransferase n=1 Tax=Corynebacterium phocae TaxID=161895 RepID=A0A1L7D1T3_9CORY|nr:4-alpha-glucanotransferase [Corynebacterium phocae]APT92105.1 4-alpha-glucanotransferase [Corynebacterium phocae]